ncbi:MAG: AAA family ATPase [Candidatus Aenigmarchaeota archaeon]|nr:AAA family ATPase [Candidatus Aenigmarchaeota archaeon]
MDEDTPLPDNLPETTMAEAAPEPPLVEEPRKPAPQLPPQWYAAAGWHWNPFTFSITTSVYVGYQNQKNSIVSLLLENHKIALILGPTGSGKTSLLKWLTVNLPPAYDSLYIAKPPAKADEFVELFSEKFRQPWYLRFFSPSLKNIYQIPDFLNRRLKKKRLVVLLDEAHEADIDVLEWLRVLSDQTEQMTIILSALPVFEEQIRDKLETLRKRIAARIEILYLTKEEMRAMIAGRIENAGGKGIEPFDEVVIDAVYERTGGFPREVLRLCDELVNRAMKEGRSRITADMLERRAETESKAVSLATLEGMTPMQRDVVEILGKGVFTPGEIADMLNLEKYKSRQHAVRSVNNILKRMLQDGLVERSPKDKAFAYHLSPKLRTLVVKA